MSKPIEGAGEALRVLAKGQTDSLTICERVGWPRRTGGPKMRSLEGQGLVRRVMVKAGTLRSDAKYEWVLTTKGREAVSSGSAS